MRKNINKILIVGDAGRGKTTLAKRLSKKMNIPYYSTDDFFWKIKFSEKQDPTVASSMITGIYDSQKWIIEGTTLSLVQMGYKKADVIIYLIFPNVLHQWAVILRRHTQRPYETWKDVFMLLRHVVYKKYRLGYKRNDVTIEESLSPFNDKVVMLSSFAQIDDFFDVIEVKR